MRITVYGTRGSYPVCRREVLRYGGNTTCLFLESDGQRVVIDGGSGVVPLGEKLTRLPEAERSLSLVLTHPHWDHVLGLPYFKPFYEPSFSVRVYGADSENKTLEGVVVNQHNRENFPVAFEHLLAKITTHRVAAGDTIELGSMRVRTFQLNHPGYDLGYRFEAPSGTFVILTDLAPIQNNLLGAGMSETGEGRQAQFEQEYYSGLVDFVRGADLVYHDTNFTDEEIEGRVHWGHSTPTHALALLSQLDSPPGLILSHHDPDHSDDQLDAIYAATRSDGKSRGIEVLIAKEGGSFQL